MILIIDCKSEHLKRLVEMLNGLNINHEVRSLEDIPTDFKEFSGIIISGSPIRIYHLKDKFKFIKELKVPLLGVCFGHQALGYIFGSKLIIGKNIQGEIELEILDEDDLFQGIKHKIFFKEDHYKYISLPLDFILLAKSEKCPVEAMKHKTKNIYGVQFHPELSGESGKKLLENFCNLCKNNR